MKNSALVIRIWPLLLAALAACASTSDRGEEYRPSGFLGEHPELTRSPRDPDWMIWIAEETDWTRYDRILIDPVKVLVPEGSSSGIAAEEYEELGELFRSILEAEFRQGYEVVSGPGEGVLRCRFALTSVLPAVDKDRGERSPAERFDLGGASTELEVLDGSSGERLAVGVSTKKAEAVYTKRLPYTTKGQTETVFRDWARRVRTGLGLRQQR